VRDLTTLPKVHLHVHLESTVRWSTLRELAVAGGVPVPDEPANPLVFQGFREFADYNTLIRESLRRPVDFARVAREFCADQA
jgi:adenosine deaminase